MLSLKYSYHNFSFLCQQLLLKLQKGYQKNSCDQQSHNTKKSTVTHESR